MAVRPLFLVICFGICTTTYGCGPLQAGRERTINFIVTNFKLPAVMAFAEDSTQRAKVTTLSASMSDAQTFVQSLIMRNVEDVLYEQGRSAFLPDNVISSILQQMDVQISYDPLKCEIVVIDAARTGAMMDKVNCVIIDGTVTNICNKPGNLCQMAMIDANLIAVPPKYLTISGSLRTTNGIMANWSNQMWQSVLNRVLRRITSDTNGSLFFGASVNLR